MRGNAMTIKPDNASVTILRTNTSNPQSPPPSQEETPAADGATVYAPPKDSTAPVERVTVTQEKQGNSDGTSPSRLGGLLKYKKQGVILLVTTAIVAIGLKQSGIAVPFLTDNHSRSVEVMPAARLNASGITPPELLQQPTKPAAQKVDLPPSPLPGPVVQVTAKPLMSPEPQLEQAVVPALAAPALEAPDHPMLDNQDIPVAHYEAGPTTTANPMASSDVQHPHQDMGSDRLFIEMHKQLDLMSNQMKELQNRLESTQQALNERVSTGLGKIDGRLDELQHREDLIEAQKKTVSESVPEPAHPKVQQAVSAKTADLSPSGVSERHVTKKPPKEPAPVTLPHYTVQAGAPDIAILMDSSGTPLRVQPGSNLDGWGNVIAVMPSGNGWIVKTEHGTIR